MFINDTFIDSTDVIPLAVAEDGHILASHYCSHKAYVAHDMGITSNWKHDAYNEHYPDGWELEWIESEDAPNHIGLNEAMRLNSLFDDDEATMR